MADYKENSELSTSNPSFSSTTTKSSSSVFNRSMTTNSFPKKISSSSSYVSSAASTIVDRNAVSMKKWYNSAGTSLKGKVRQLRTLFETPKSLNNYDSTSDNNEESSHHSHHYIGKLRPVKSFSTDNTNNNKDSWLFSSTNVRFPGTEDRVVVYFTSLRGVRRTYEDCHAVRMIFRGFKVFVDERDVSMDADYRKELLGLLGETNVTLPQVFIKGRHMGGVDVIRGLNETGELRKLLQGMPMKDRRFMCGSCGDARFLPCSNCSGSRKLFDEDEEVMKRCLECNENGLIRCPECCL